jgi:hypothetical protein
MAARCFMRSIDTEEAALWLAAMLAARVGARGRRVVAAAALLTVHNCAAVLAEEGVVTGHCDGW